jgi:hypothetical protein
LVEGEAASKTPSRGGLQRGRRRHVPRARRTQEQPTQLEHVQREHTHTHTHTHTHGPEHTAVSERDHRHSTRMTAAISRRGSAGCE